MIASTLKIIGSLLLLAVSSLVCAQDGETRLGFKAGLTSADIYGPDTNQLSSGGSTSPLQGFHAGIFVNSKIRRNFWLKSEVLYVQKGSTIQIKDAWNPVYKSKFTSSVIDIYPLSATFHIKGFQLLAGPYVSLLLNSSLEQKDSLGVMSTNQNIFGNPIALSKYRQKLDAGWLIGVEYEIRQGISIGARYNWGFIPLFENAAAVVKVNAPELPQQKIYNQSLLISIGYSLVKNQSKAKNSSR